MINKKKLYVFWFSLFLAIALTPSTKVLAENKDSYFEIGIGVGTNLLQSLDTQQVLIIPAMNWRIVEKKKLWFRFEGNAELIKADNKIAFVVGVAPMLRKFFLEVKSGLIPFVEIGAGLNLISHNGIKDRRFGGCFIFSIMAGAGIEFKSGGHPIKISYRYRHLSNGGIYSPNEGIDSHYLIFSAGF